VINTLDFLEPKRSGKIFSPEVKDILLNWIKEHQANPYPTRKERAQLVEKTGLTRKQMRNWMSDARRVRFIGVNFSANSFY